MKKIDQYTYRVSWSEEDGEFVGMCAEFPSLSWLDGTPELALTGIRKVVSASVRDMNKAGEKLPEPLASRAYSGKFMVRVPPQLHRELTTQAAEAGVSLNRLIAHKLASD
jgi:predicted HicB family RNase H-like nuclease